MPEVAFPSNPASGYCVKCHESVEMRNPESFTNRRGVQMIRARCEKCKSMVHRFVGKSSAASAEPKEAPRPKRKRKSSKSDPTPQADPLPAPDRQT